MKITIYIVDDEYMALQYFHCLLESVKLEYEVVGQATNSVKALKEIVSLKPDVVFADINMPIMDGLELSQQILRQVSSKIFLLTSYRDFDYVKKGIQIGIADYILKNELTESTLEDILQKAASDLYVEKKKQHLLLEHNVRNFLLSESDTIEDHVYEHRPMQRYALISVRRPPVIYIRHHGAEKKQNVDCYELHNLTYPPGIECSAFTEMESGELCGIFFIHGEVTDGQAALEKASEEILAYLKGMDRDYCCLISDTMYHFFEMQAGYRKLQETAEYIYASPSKTVFRVSELSGKNSGYSWDGNLEKLGSALEKQELEEALCFLDGLFVQWRENLKIWEYTENLQSIFRYLRTFIKMKNLRPAIMEIPDSYMDVLAAENTLKNCAEFIIEEIRQEKNRDYSVYVQQAIAYIHKNYGRDISIPDIAQAAQISEGHLRRLFKQELNTKVVDYLTEYRLEAARLLMKNTQESLSEIWQKTGFTSAQYFSYVFKRKEGILPKEYLKRVRNE